MQTLTWATSGLAEHRGVARPLAFTGLEGRAGERRGAPDELRAVPQQAAREQVRDREHPAEAVEADAARRPSRHQDRLQASRGDAPGERARRDQPDVARGVEVGPALAKDAELQRSGV